MATWQDLKMHILICDSLQKSLNFEVLEKGNPE